MVRISKLTDYGVVIMALMASDPLRLFQSREIATRTAIAAPTVSKLLKKLSKNNLLHSQRGAAGGYLLASKPEQISVAALITALEGPIAITECSLGHSHCSSTPFCTVKAPWLEINKVISNALESIKLSDLSHARARTQLFTTQGEIHG